MHKLNSGANSFFKLSRIKPKIFSTQAVNCCLNSIAGYLASTCEKPSSNPPIYLKGDFSPWRQKQTKSDGYQTELFTMYKSTEKVKGRTTHIFMQALVKAIRDQIEEQIHTKWINESQTKFNNYRKARYYVI